MIFPRFFFLKLIIFMAGFYEKFTKHFHAILNSVCFTLIFYAYKLKYCRNWWNMFAYFCYRWIFRIIFTSINLFYYTFKISTNNKWYYIRFLILINSNILVPLQRIITLQKSLFSHTFLCDSSLLFVLKEWRQSK